MSRASKGELTLSHRETAKRGAFHLGSAAEMTYSRPTPDVMKVNHTLVDQAHRGKGLAHQLHAAMVRFAREHDRKVVPVCPFVAAMFEQHLEDADLLV